MWQTVFQKAETSLRVGGREAPESVQGLLTRGRASPKARMCPRPCSVNWSMLKLGLEMQQPWPHTGLASCTTRCGTGFPQAQQETQRRLVLFQFLRKFLLKSEILASVR